MTGWSSNDIGNHVKYLNRLEFWVFIPSNWHICCCQVLSERLKNDCFACGRRSDGQDITLEVTLWWVKLDQRWVTSTNCYSWQQPKAPPRGWAEALRSTLLASMSNSLPSSSVAVNNAVVDPPSGQPNASAPFLQPIAVSAASATPTVPLMADTDKTFESSHDVRQVFQQLPQVMFPLVECPSEEEADLLVVGDSSIALVEHPNDPARRGRRTIAELISNEPPPRNQKGVFEASLGEGIEFHRARGHDVWARCALVLLEAVTLMVARLYSRIWCLMAISFLGSAKSSQICPFSWVEQSNGNLMDQKHHCARKHRKKLSTLTTRPSFFPL